MEGLGVTGEREDQATVAALLRRHATAEAMRSRTGRRMNKFEQLAISTRHGHTGEGDSPLSVGFRPLQLPLPH